MKKLLASMLILTLSFNSFGTNCSAASETSEKIKQIKDNLAQIKNKTLSETNKEISKEEIKTEQKDDSESCENKTSDSTADAQNDANKPTKKSFREKQIEKLNKEIQNLEEISMRTAKILGISLIIFFIFSCAAISACFLISNLDYLRGYDDGLKAGKRTVNCVSPELKERIKSVLKLFIKNYHPDYLYRIKSFDEIKEMYYKMNSLLDDLK